MPDLLSVRPAPADRRQRKRQKNLAVRQRRSRLTFTGRVNLGAYPPVTVWYLVGFYLSPLSDEFVSRTGAFAFVWALERLLRYREVDPDVPARRFPRGHGRNGDLW